MKAEIKPLMGKYYGTIIKIVEKYHPLEGREIDLWFASGSPSRRELELYSMGEEEWRRDLMCDSHYECAETLRVAEAIVEALKPL